MPDPLCLLLKTQLYFVSLVGPDVLKYKLYDSVFESIEKKMYIRLK